MKNFWIILFISILCAFKAFAEVSFEAGINIETEAENSAAAKETALKKANREAFLKVASRLTTDENVRTLEKLTDEQLSHFIREVAVVSEKSGAKTYRADLNITINGLLLKQYMAENNMLEVTGAPSQVLVIPVYSDTEYSEKVLWEDGNIWRNAWLEKGLIKSGSLDLKVLEDTAPNKGALSVNQALDMSEDTFNQLRFLNGIKDIFVVHAVRAGRNHLVLIVRTVPANDEKRFVIADESGAIFEPAIAEAVAYITQTMQGKTLAESQNQGNMQGVFYYFRLREWLEAEKKLKNIPQIKNVRTSALGGGKVQFVIDYSGSVEGLQHALEQSGLSLASSNNDIYILK